MTTPDVPVSRFSDDNPCKAAGLGKIEEFNNLTKDKLYRPSKPKGNRKQRLGKREKELTFDREKRTESARRGRGARERNNMKEKETRWQKDTIRTPSPRHLNPLPDALRPESRAAVGLHGWATPGIIIYAATL